LADANKEERHGRAASLFFVWAIVPFSYSRAGPVWIRNDIC
jgi:hypothetical protein